MIIKRKTAAMDNDLRMPLLWEDVKTTELIINEQEVLEIMDRITIKPIKNGEYYKVLNVELLSDWLRRSCYVPCCEAELTLFLKEFLLIARKGGKSKEFIFLLIQGYFAQVFAFKNHKGYWDALLLRVQCLLDTEALNNRELRLLKVAILSHKKKRITFGLGGYHKALRLLYKKHPLLLFS